MFQLSDSNGYSGSDTHELNTHIHSLETQVMNTHIHSLDVHEIETYVTKFHIL